MNKFVGVFAAAIVASGCVVDVVFEPLGGDVVVDGAWTINGGVADAVSCGTAGIATVQLFVCDAIDGDCFESADFRSACENGGFVSAPLLERQFYAYYWAALDAGNVELGRSGWQTADVTGGGPLVATADFVMDMPGEVTMDATWTINGIPADGGSCGLAGINFARLEVTDTTGAVFRSWDLDCSLGGFDSRTDAAAPSLPEGEYFTQWFAIDTAGTAVADGGAALPLDVRGQSHATLATPDFFIEMINSLDVAILYDVGDGTFGDCTTAGVDGIWGYVLSSVGGATIAMEAGLTCQNGILFEDVASDTYILDINADASDGAKWGGECTGLDVLRGLEEYDCQIPITPPDP